ncbi:hypothetical protein QBC38DRAFT_360410 [Podospora fimiseda]|uniref:2EXR domain-containing protein n=1 Tax=Podospora fimiseda TaxID=252190 RepID=A0AAN7BTC7_9PEZI|nr:hypothetical protein QBC38DRAFT_360410 [Podospora fimiseda]
MMHYDLNYHRPRGPALTVDRFDNFKRLPAEIRNMIWEYSLPESRVYEVLDAPNSKLKTPAQKGLMFANVHPEPPPALAAVCRESRNFVLHHYKPLTLGTTTKYLDLSRDILLLEPYLLVKRLHRALHFMSQIPMVRDNINRLALGTSYGIYPGIFHPVLSWKVSKTNVGKLLASLAKFPRLKTLVFVVHQEFQFEFDARFPGTMTPIPQALIPGTPSSPVVATLSPPSHDSFSTLQQQFQAQHQRPPQQLIHQAYRFKFDIESNINHTPHRRPHHNSLVYYPLPIDEENEDWDLGEIGEEGEWCDPRPTNDDWRRFRKRFCWAMEKSLEEGGPEVVGVSGSSCCRKRKREEGDNEGGGVKKVASPGYELKGASLLWRYGNS